MTPRQKQAVRTAGIALIIGAVFVLGVVSVVVVGDALSKEEFLP